MRAILLAISLFTTLPSFGAESVVGAAIPRVDAGVASARLEAEVGERLARVREFKFIRQEAARLGVRVYLFGGSAAGFAHYVRWDLEREGGARDYRADRFDYDFTSIYRANQDLDLVVDGEPRHAQVLEESLQREFPYLQGNKSVWEVRLLRQDTQDKLALLHNPEFLGQHTDSNSTGLIELTPPAKGEPLIRDLRDWESPEPHFLRDAAEGKLHYYFSDKHETTRFYREGRNPPILSVIRYLTKAFQYGLELRPEDLARVRTVVDAFDPKGKEMQDSYVKNWLLHKENGRKLIQSALDMEYAWDALERLGLRKKLIAIENNPETRGSLAWWMSREPLRSKPVGQGTGGTARELGFDVLAHESDNFTSYESITKAHAGDPNVFISRDHHVGEAAAYGDGFYTAAGRSGARGTGYTIRFHLNPEAREGEDFVQHRFEHGVTYVVVLNKRAIRVIPESLRLEPVDFFERLATGKGIDASERGVLDRLGRAISHKIQGITPADQEKIYGWVKDSVGPDRINENLAEYWLKLPVSVRHPEFPEKMLDAIFTSEEDGGKIDRFFIRNVLENPLWSSRPEATAWFEKIFASRYKWTLLKPLSREPWASHPKAVGWIEEALAKNSEDLDEVIAEHFLTSPAWLGRPETDRWIEQLFEHRRADLIAYHAMDSVALMRSPRGLPLMKRLLSYHYPPVVRSAIFRGIDNGPWDHHPQVGELIELALAHVGTDESSLKNTFQKPHLAALPGADGWVDRLVWIADHNLYVMDMLSSEAWKNHPMRHVWLERLFSQGAMSHMMQNGVENMADIYSLRKPVWAQDPALKAICKDGVVNAANLQAAFDSGFSFETDETRMRARAASCLQRWSRLAVKRAK